MGEMALWIATMDKVTHEHRLMWSRAFESLRSERDDLRVKVDELKKFGNRCIVGKRCACVHCMVKTSHKVLVLKKPGPGGGTDGAA